MIKQMNKVVKILSIMGVLIFGFLCISTFLIEVDADALRAVGLIYRDVEDYFYSAYSIAMVSSIFGFILSVCGLFIPFNTKKDRNKELLELGQLKEKGILTDEEFDAKKRDLLTK